MQLTSEYSFYAYISITLQLLRPKCLFTVLESPLAMGGYSRLSLYY